MIKKPNILVVGSFVMDHFATTTLFPRQGETVLGEAFWQAPGGKGANQAVQAARLGANVTMVGKVGRDQYAQALLNSMNEDGVDTSCILFDDNKPTACSFVILELGEDGSSNNRIIVIPGSNMTITAEEIGYLEHHIRNYDMVMLQLEIPMEINELVCKYAHQAGVPVMLNPAPSDDLSKEMLANLTYISPNEHETFNMTGVAIPTDNDSKMLMKAQEACTALRSSGARNAMITMGSKGAAFMGDEGFSFSPSVEGVSAVDPTAAGDSFVASFCWAKAVGLTNSDSLIFANHAAAITVSRKGAIPALPTLEEVQASLSDHGIQLAW